MRLRELFWMMGKRTLLFSTSPYHFASDFFVPCWFVDYGRVFSSER